MIPKTFKLKNEVIVGRLSRGSDLIVELTRICKIKNITNGIVHGIGALKFVTIGYYDQEKRGYILNKIEKPVEVLVLKGNISMKDNDPFVHAHIVLGDRKGDVYGGHLTEGSFVFAFEYTIIPFEGGYLKREFDEETGLYLWGL